MLRKLPLFIATFLSLSAYAQDWNNLAVDATVKDQNGGRITSATVSLVQDGNVVNKVTTGRNGRFDLYLDFGHEYIIEIAKSGFASKRLYFNTHNVPEDEQSWGYEFGGFIVDLFREIDGIDYSILEDPIGKVYYDPNIQNFEYDRVYTKQIKQRIEKLQDDYKEKIKQEEQRLKQLEEDYEMAMRDAANAMKDGDFLTAKENYLAAASIKPDEQDPKSKLAEIEGKLASANKTEDQYMSALASADQLFAEAKYAEAKTKYQEAGTIKPKEDYPKNRVAECDKAIADLKAKEEAEAQMAAEDRAYNEAIAKGDKAFNEGKYQNAKINYQNALNVKKDEGYPKDQLKLIEQKLSELADAEAKQKEQAAIDAKYAAQIDKADAAFNSGNYENARNFYKAASEIKTAEEYPRTQLVAIDEKLAALQADAEADAEQKRKEEQYRKLIADGDKLLSGGKYQEAIGVFTDAATLKPDEEYPKQKLDEIAQKVAALLEEKEAEALQKEYDDLIAKADAQLEQADYDAAKSSYDAALALKPKEAYPKAQLEKIDQLKADAERQREAQEAEAALTAEYNGLVKAADEAYDQQDYALAKEKYKAALQLKKNEKYPQERIDLCDQKLGALAKAEQDAAERAALEKRYSEAIAKADEAFNAEDYERAREHYIEARDIDGEESYPREQLRLIDTKLSELVLQEEQAAKQARDKEKYDNLIAEADGQFDNEKWTDARNSYNLAAGIMPNETYPKDRIAAIDKLLAEMDASKERELAEQRAREEQERIDKAYAAAIAAADAFMGSSDYEEAKAKYTEAEKLKSTESYPGEQLKVIEQRLAEIAAKEQAEGANRAKYNEWIRKGDKAIQDQDWDAARAAYREALSLFESEPIPKARLEEIDDLEKRAEEERIALEYSKAIAEADRAFLNEQYGVAEAAYQRALEFKPGDSHATARLAKIGEIASSGDRNGPQKASNTKKEITEETYDEGRSKVTIRRVKQGDRELVYKRVVHSWGGKYYFLDDRPITEQVWNKETTP